MLLFVTGNYQATSDCGPHTATDWEVAEDPGFNTILLQDYDDNINLTSYFYSGSVPVDPQTGEFIIYIRARFKSATCTSDWFPVKQYTYIPPSVPIIRTPVLTVEGFPTLTPRNPALSATAFEMMFGIDNYISTSWIVEEETTGTVVFQSLEDQVNINNIVLPTDTLDWGTRYNFKVRYHGQITSSDWGVVNSLVEQVIIEAPTVSILPSPGTGDPNGDMVSFVINSSAFNVTNGTDTHQSTDWQIWDSSGLNLLWEEQNDTVNLTSKSIPSLLALQIGIDYGDTIRVKVRYNGQLSQSSWGTVLYTFPNINIQAPTITPAYSNEHGSPLLEKNGGIYTLSSFQVLTGYAEHVSTSWWVKNSANEIIWSSVHDDLNLESIMIPDNVFSYGTQYTIFAVFNGKSATSVNNYIGDISSNEGQITATVEPDPETVSGFVSPPTLISYPVSSYTAFSAKISGGMYVTSAYVTTAPDNDFESVDYELVDQTVGGLLVFSDNKPISSYTSGDLVNLFIPDGVLEYEHSYYLRLKYNGENYSSVWNDEQFTVEQEPFVQAPIVSISNYRYNGGTYIYPPTIAFNNPGNVNFNSSDVFKVPTDFSFYIKNPVFIYNDEITFPEPISPTQSELYVEIKDKETNTIIHTYSEMLDVYIVPGYSAPYHEIVIPPGLLAYEKSYDILAQYKDTQITIPGVNDTVIVSSDLSLKTVTTMSTNKWELHTFWPYVPHYVKAVFSPKLDKVVGITSQAWGTTLFHYFIYDYKNQTYQYDDNHDLNIVGSNNYIYPLSIVNISTTDGKEAIVLYRNLAGSGNRLIIEPVNTSDLTETTNQEFIPLDPGEPDNDPVDEDTVREATLVGLTNNEIGIFLSHDILGSARAEIINYLTYDVDQKTFSDTKTIYRVADFSEPWNEISDIYGAEKLTINNREVVCLFLMTTTSFTTSPFYSSIFVFDAGSMVFLGRMSLENIGTTNFNIVKKNEDTVYLTSGDKVYDVNDDTGQVLEVTIKYLPGDSVTIGNTTFTYPEGKLNIKAHDSHPRIKPYNLEYETVLTDNDELILLTGDRNYSNRNVNSVFTYKPE